MDLYSAKIKNILAGCFFFTLICLMTAANNTIDMDYWARLLQGNAFWQLGHILKFDCFSYTPTHIWLDHEWGSSVIFSLIQNIFGFNGILIFKNLIIFVLFFLIYKIIKLQTSDTNIWLNILYFVFAAYSMPTLTCSGLRCHFFSFLFFTLSLYILELVRKKNRNKLLIILPVLMLFWANIHGGCVSLLGLLIMYSAGEFLNKKPFKKYIIALVFCSAVLFINPYGIDYVKFIIMATTMQRPFVTEWISPFSHPYPLFMIAFKIFYIINLLFLIFNLKKVKTDFTKYIVLFVTAYLSYKYVKNTPFFIITAIIFQYELFETLFRKLTEKVRPNSLAKSMVSILFILFILLIFIKPAVENGKYSFLSQQPVREIEFLKINKLKGNILAPFDMGSYIAYKLFPDNLIYMDGRYEEVYYDDTKKLLDDFYNVQNDGYKILDGSIKPDFIIVPNNALINDYLIKRNDYKLIYQNNINGIYSTTDKLKNEYMPPSDDNTYYEKNAFKVSFTYNDEIYINGRKIIFK